MILNSSLLSLSKYYTYQNTPFIFTQLMLLNIQLYFSSLNGQEYSSLVSKSLYSSLSTNQFSRLILPDVYLSDDQENTILRDLVYHTKMQDIENDLTLINCSFISCLSDSKKEINGGAIYINNQISLHTKNCIFRQNQARKLGSAIFAKNASLIDIDSCLFAENECRKSGPICLYKIGGIIIKSTNFTRNKSQIGTAAIAINTVYEKALLTNVQFCENEGKILGSLYFENGDLQINNCLFYFNLIHSGPSSIKLGSKSTMIINNTIFADENPPSITLTFSNTVNITYSVFSHTDKESIKARGSNCFYDNSNVFESVFNHVPIKLDPLNDIEKTSKNKLIKEDQNTISDSNREYDKEINKDDNKKPEKENNKDAGEENSKEVEKENSKDAHKEIDKGINTDSDKGNKEPVIIKHGNNQSYVLFPLQNIKNNQNSYYSVFYLILAILILFIFIIIFYGIKEKMFMKSIGQNYSIFNHEDLDANANINFSSPNEKLSELSEKDLADVKMETF